MAKTAARKQNYFKPDPVLGDPVFFHKSELRIGSRLVNMGRLEPGTRWQVTGITTFIHSASGKVRRSQVTEVRTLADDIHLTQLGGHENRTAQFSTLSYSAIWRLQVKEG